MVADLVVVGVLGLLVGGLVVRILGGGARCALNADQPPRAERVALHLYRLCRAPNIFLAVVVVATGVTCAEIGSRWLRAVCSLIAFGIFLLAWAGAQDSHAEPEVREEEGGHAG